MPSAGLHRAAERERGQPTLTPAAVSRAARPSVWPRDVGGRRPERDVTPISRTRATKHVITAQVAPAASRAPRTATRSHSAGDRLLAQHLRHRHDVEHRLMSVHAGQCAADVVHDGPRIAGRSRGDDERVGRRLRDRTIQRRYVAAVEPVVNHIATDADDSQPRSPSDPQLAAQLSTLWPVLARHRLTDDRDRFGSADRSWRRRAGGSACGGRRSRPG